MTNPYLLISFVMSRRSRKVLLKNLVLTKILRRYIRCYRSFGLGCGVYSKMFSDRTFYRMDKLHLLVNAKCTCDIVVSLVRNDFYLEEIAMLFYTHVVTTTTSTSLRDSSCIVRVTAQ